MLITFFLILVSRQKISKKTYCNAMSEALKRTQWSQSALTLENILSFNDNVASICRRKKAHGNFLKPVNVTRPHNGDSTWI